MSVLRSSLIVATLAIGGFAAQPSSPAPVEAPLREIQWSNQINFLHSTDTHAWSAGHLNEASYSADWGDFISFTHHLRKRADKDGSDLLLIDSGDRVEGNGLYDISKPIGKYTYEFVKSQDFDVLICGNHELYKANTSNAEYEQLIPHFKENYVASNVDILDPKSGERVPLAQRFRKFQTKNQKIQVMAFGFLLNFNGNSNHTFVEKAVDTVKQQWFQDAIRDRSIDLFVVAGHADVHGSEFSAIYSEIRKQQWDAPIIFFGGHLHVRAYKKFDSKAYGIASGRYMETIGFQSISGLSVGGKGRIAKALASPTFSRRYIDNNLYSLQHHSNTTNETFHTELGQNVTKSITKARKELGLNERYGCAPRDLWMSRVPYPAGQGSESSIYTWLANQVLPDMVRDKSREKIPRTIMANTGGIRFDIFKGEFTRDTLYSIQPFTNSFRYIPDVPFDMVDKLIIYLRDGSPILNWDGDLVESENLMMLPPEQRAIILHSHLPNEHQHTSYIDTHGIKRGAQQQFPLTSEFKPLADTDNDKDKSSNFFHSTDEKLTPGYTTVDDAGDDGDDTQHSAIPYFKSPNIFFAHVNTTVGAEANVDKVDLVYIDFIQPRVLSGLQFFGSELAVKDTKSYADGKGFTRMIEEWVRENWNGKVNGTDKC